MSFFEHQHILLMFQCAAIVGLDKMNIEYKIHISTIERIMHYVLITLELICIYMKCQ